MERRIGKFGAAAFAAALLIEGCSPAINQAPKATLGPEAPSSTPVLSPSQELPSPPVVLVDCQKNPLDYNLETTNFVLRPGESIAFSAITKMGQEDSLTFNPVGPGKMGYREDQSKFSGIFGKNAASVEDENVFFDVRWVKDGENTLISGAAACIDFLKSQQPTS